MNRQVRSYIEHELRHYHETKRELEQLRDSILNETGGGDISGIRGSGTGDPTAKKAMRLMTNARLKRLEETVTAIDNVVESLDGDKYRLVELNYWEKPRTLTDMGMAQRLNVGQRTFYRWRDGIVHAIAMEMGLS